MSDDELRLFVVCGLIALINFVLFCACSVALLRVLKVAARDAYSSPRRRLLALDDGVPRRIPGRVMAVLGAFRPFTTQKALLSMLTLSAAREYRFWVLPWFQIRTYARGHARILYLALRGTAVHRCGASISRRFGPHSFVLDTTVVYTRRTKIPPPHRL